MKQNDRFVFLRAVASHSPIGAWCVLFLVLITLAAPVAAQSNEDCFMCHDDPEAVGERAGLEVSVFVDPATYSASVHAEFSCIDCHEDLTDAELPHQEELVPVECAMCHEDEALDQYAGPHGRWAKEQSSPSADCRRCHGVHDVLPRSDPASAISHSRVNQLCASCHVTAQRQVANSPHMVNGINGEPNAACVECHAGHGLKAPRDPIGQLSTCGVCHPEQERQHRRSLHGKAAVHGDALAPSCVTCHGHHEILRHTDSIAPTAKTNVPLLCGRCHREGSEVTLQHDIPQHRILENFSMSVHGEGLFSKGLTVTAVCTSCHTAHDILDHNHPDSSINRDNVAATCMNCHARIEEVHVKFIEGRLWEEEPHKVPSCVECHQPHKIRKPAPAGEGAGTRNCMRCHADPNLKTTREGQEVSLCVNEDAYDLSSHNNVACAQCHTDVDPRHELRPCATIVEKVDCGICHAERVEEHELSRHGKLVEDADPAAPTCLTCHGEAHEIIGRRFPTSPTYSRSVPELCGRCHSRGGVAADRIESEIFDIVDSYMNSAHGKGLIESGLVVSASCIDCHTAHRALPTNDERSSVHPDNIADTCGNCHRGIQEQFATSIHWPGKAVTNEPLPTCEDCHSSHTISRVDVEGFRLRMMNQCGRCHEDYAETFFDTYHGKVTQLGAEGAAACYDCHGTHTILPPSDPASSLSRRHVVETCAQCHPRAHLQFAGYLSHATHHDPERYPSLFWAFWFMTSLLVGTLALFMIHTLLWLFRLWRTRGQWRPLKAKAGEEKRYYRRFSLKQRLMHLFMLLSFFMLALTGMALKFSFMGWAHVVSTTLGGFSVMGTLHRIAAIVLLLVFAYHLRDIVKHKVASGKGWFRFVFSKNSLMFNFNDLRVFLQSVKWFLGRGQRPQYGRFTYWEKFDYFAVFWGVFVIGSTGLLLWFPELFTRVLPGWSVNVATIIHSDEALLAVGFIFTIHFFNTHFRPDKFPMDPVIFTGRVSLDELKHDKPDEYEEFVENASVEKRAERIAGPASPSFEKVARIFGFTALFIGLLLIGLIVYSVLFGYR